MVKELIKALKRKEVEVAAMEARIAHELREELADLPAFYGFDSLPGFLKAVERAIEGPAKKRRKARKIVRKKRRQAKITSPLPAKAKKPIKKARKKRSAAKKTAPSAAVPTQAATEAAPPPADSMLP
jgi:hypothetical protein